jgi:DNA-binding NarL/FixJ family response regulator
LANVQFAKRYRDDRADSRAQRLTSALRLILVGTAEERAALRARLSETAVVAGEFSTLSAANGSAISADAIVTARPQWSMPDDPAEHLTPREIEVLELLAEGLPNKAIALRLGISDQTVKFHVASICGKLSAANRTDAVRRAIRRGLITV